MGFSFKSLTKPFRKVLKPVKKIWKKGEDLAHKMGVDKDHIGNSLADAVGMVNPTAGAVLKIAGKGKEGIKEAIRNILISNVFNNRKLLDLSASGRGANIRGYLNKLKRNPSELIKNTLLAGGDIKQGLMKTLLQMNPNLQPYLGNIFSQVGDLGAINLGNFGIKDAIGLYSLMKYIKTKEPPLPEAPTMELIDDSVINYNRPELPNTPELNYMKPEDLKYNTEDIYKSYENIMNQKLEDALQRTAETYNARGMLRSGTELAGENRLRSDVANQLANYRANLEKEKALQDIQANRQAIEYNNQLKQQAYNNLLQNYDRMSEQERQAMMDRINLIERNNQIRQQAYNNLLQRYGIQSQLTSDKMNALGNIAGDYLVGRGAALGNVMNMSGGQGGGNNFVGDVLNTIFGAGGLINDGTGFTQESSTIKPSFTTRKIPPTRNINLSTQLNNNYRNYLSNLAPSNNIRRGGNNWFTGRKWRNIRTGEIASDKLQTELINNFKPQKPKYNYKFLEVNDPLKAYEIYDNMPKPFLYVPPGEKTAMQKAFEEKFGDMDKIKKQYYRKKYGNKYDELMTAYRKNKNAITFPFLYGSNGISFFNKPRIKRF